MKALSLWQPWASLWCSPNKRHETRDWQMHHRGRLLVHATKKFVRDVDDELEDILSSEFGGHWGMELPTGALIGAVDVLDCIPTQKLYRNLDRMTDDDRIDFACGNFSDGRYGFLRGTYWIFREPIPYRGHQTIFDVPNGVVADAFANAREFIGG